MRMNILALAAATLLVVAPDPGLAQGPPEHAQAKKEQAKERGPQGAPGQEKARGPQSQRQGQSQARGQAQARGGPPAHARAKRGGPAPDLETFNRNLVEKAVRARGRKAERARAVELRRDDDRIRVVREDGRELFALDRETAGELGYWRAAVVPDARDRRDRDDARLGGIFGTGDRYPAEDRDREGPPAFCRSGEGHPVWGRDWCIDKGFGLGDGNGVWGVDRDIGDIILRRPDPERRVVDRGGLIDVLGDVVFGRLALQSLVLGADEPLEGRWLAEREGPRVLRVQAGDLPVAELIDYGRDDSVDRIVFNLGG